MKRLGLVLLLASGCFTDPDTFYSFRGTVHAARPEASRGAQVTLSVERQAQRMGECSGDVVRTALTDADGGYGFEALAAELFDAALGPRAACVRLETTFDGGAKAWADLDFISETKLSLPTLEEWVPSASVDGGTLTFRPFGPRRMDAGRFQTTGHRAVLRAGGAVGWVVADTGPLDGGAPDTGSFAFGPEALEDFPFAVDLEAFRWEEVPVFAGLSAPVSPTTLRSNRARVRTGLELRGTVVPASRGAACPGLGSPCPLTDGRLEPVAFDAARRSFVFEFARPMAPRRVVVRGIEAYGPMTVVVDGTETVEPRDPQQEWPLVWPRTDQASGEPLFATYELQSRGAATSITLEFETPVQSLAEVSFFE